MMHSTPRELAGEPFTGAATPADSAQEDGHLLVRIGAEWFAIALRDAEEAVESPVLRELALGPAACVGAVWWRAQHLPVHAAPALGVVPSYPPQAVLVLAGSPPTAIALDDVADVVPLAPSQIRPLPGLRDPFGVVLGAAWHQGQLLTVVSGPALISSLVQAAPPSYGAPPRREVA